MTRPQEKDESLEGYTGQEKLNGRSGVEARSFTTVEFE